MGTVAGYGGPNAGCSGRCTFAGARQRVRGKYGKKLTLLYWLAAVNIYRCKLHVLSLALRLLNPVQFKRGNKTSHVFVDR